MKQVAAEEEGPMGIADLPEYVRIPAVAKFLDISSAQVWRMVWSSELPSVRLSERIVRVRKADLIAWLERKAVAV